MQVLFAPWRLEYILSEKKPEDCIFCDMVASADDEGKLVVLRTERSIVALNRYPYNNGHLMVAPMRHIGSLAELDETEILDVFKTLRLCELVLTRLLQPEGFNMGINIGRCAGAGVLGHVHVHIVPRFSGDSNFMTTVSQVRVIPELLSETFERLRSGFASLSAEDEGKT